MSGAATFLGPLCRRGHDHNQTGKSLRYVSSPSCCIECRKGSSKQWSETNAEHHKALKQSWQKSNKQHGANWKQQWRTRQHFVSKAYESAKTRAHSLRLPFSLTKEFLQELWDRQEGRCHWLKVKLEPNAKRTSPQKATLDRLVPEFGYVTGNLVWASSFANLGRNNTSVEDFEAFLKALHAEEY